MKNLGRSAALIAASALVTAGAFTSSASAAAHEPPKFLGHPKEWGMVTLHIKPGTVTPMTTVSAGGGTWNYGSGISGVYKSCWSDYVHPTKYHSATAVIGSSTSKYYNNAGSWADAYATAGLSYTCNVYWATY